MNTALENEPIQLPTETRIPTLTRVQPAPAPPATDRWDEAVGFCLIPNDEMSDEAKAALRLAILDERSDWMPSEIVGEMVAVELKAKRRATVRRRIKIAAAGLMIAACLAVTWSQTKYRFVAKRFGVVVPASVYRSGQISRWMFEPTVKEYGIKAVIDLQGVSPDSEHQHAEIAAYERLGLEHYRFPLGGDGMGDIRHYADALATIVDCQKRGYPVLFHCAAGAQRTGGICATYRVFVEGKSPEEAIEEMESYGWDPVDDADLRDYMNQNMRTLAEMLVERGVIKTVPNPLPVM